MRTSHMQETIYQFGPHIDAAIARLDAPATGIRPMRGDRQERSVVREGVLAGTFAATGVAAAFALLDGRLVGQWLFTPSLLGAGLARLLGLHAIAGSTLGAAIAYTVVHFAAFVLLATIVAMALRRAQYDARALAAVLLLFAVAEVAFGGFLALLTQTSATAAAAWPQLALGNVLGWLLLGGWMWHAHPEVVDEFADMVDGVESSASH